MNAPLPLDAATPDEVLAAALDQGLSPAERATVERWLAQNPAWQPRAAGYAAVRAGARTAPAGVDIAPPAVSALTDLWSAIDAESARHAEVPAFGPTEVGAPLPPPRAWAATPAPASEAPGLPVSLTRERTRRRGTSARWLAAAAAVLVVGTGTVVAVNQGRSDESGDDAVAEPDPTSPQDVPGVTPAAPDEASAEPDASSQRAEALAALRASVEATSTQRTANVTFRGEATRNIAGSDLAADIGVDELVLEMVGRGQVELPGRAIINTRTTYRAGDRTDVIPPEFGSVVEDGERTWIRCAGQADYVDSSDEAAGDCLAISVGPETFGVDATFDIIEEAGMTSTPIEEIGTDTLGDGTVITGYQTVMTSPAPDSSEPYPVALQIWIDDDSLIRRIVSGGTYGGPGEETTLVLAYDLTDFGVPVDIPDLD